MKIEIWPQYSDALLLESIRQEIVYNGRAMSGPEIVEMSRRSGHPVLKVREIADREAKVILQ